MLGSIHVNASVKSKTDPMSPNAETFLQIEWVRALLSSYRRDK